jgi:hypothetical protein
VGSYPRSVLGTKRRGVIVTPEREQQIREEARDVFLAHRVAGMRFFQARAAMMRDMTAKYGNDIDWVEILAALLKVLLILVPLFTEEGT